MTPRERIKGLYAIVDDGGPDPLATARAILAGGGRLLQLRAKGSSTGRFLHLAEEMADLCRGAGALFMVNDRVDIALAVGADGVHLGQEDLPLAAARRLLGGGRLIGLSTHSLEEALAAQAEGADYIGFGPLFRTSTKKDAQAEKGLDALRGVRGKIRLPIVGIGGIGPGNLPAVLAAGADAAAMISALTEGEDVAKRTAEIVRIAGGAK